MTEDHQYYNFLSKKITELLSKDEINDANKMKFQYLTDEFIRIFDFYFKDLEILAKKGFFREKDDILTEEVEKINTIIKNISFIRESCIFHLIKENNINIKKYNDKFYNYIIIKQKK